KLCRDTEDQKPLLFYSQELSRNFKDSTDPFSKRHIIKVYTPSNHMAAADSALEHKFNDTVLAFKTAIPDYSPLTDINSQKMNLFLDHDTAQFMSDVGINIDGLGEDFQSIESVSSNPYLEDIAVDASKLKTELANLKNNYRITKEQMAGEFKEHIDPRTLDDDAFAEALSHEKVSQSLVQTYLSLKEQIQAIEAQLGEVSSVVFNETKSKIKLPKLIEEKANEKVLWF
ncbi:hypothetical protein ACFL7D_11580, partial [candidate division KSB1 bacterium]